MHGIRQGIAALLFCLGSTAALATPREFIVAAEYVEPTRRYAHGVLGDEIEWGALKITVDQCPKCARTALRSFLIRLPEHRVFEDTEPRIVDLQGEGAPSVVVVESDANKGARLAVYTENGFVTGTPFIGRSNRWLAPIGAADLDGDGAIELAYIDRPHLAKTLRVWRYMDGILTEVAAQAGFTNHRIGERDIAGGIRTCEGKSEMIVATADWSRMVAVTFRNGSLNSRDLGPHKDRDSFAKALRCS
jgi:hypothetical protein